MTKSLKELYFILDLLTKARESVSKDKTILIVAHRLTKVRKCDRIVFFIDGVV